MTPDEFNRRDAARRRNEAVEAHVATIRGAIEAAYDAGSLNAPPTLDALRALTAFAATFTRSGATPAEGKLYDEADLAPNGPAIARAVAAGRAAIARAEGRAP